MPRLEHRLLREYRTVAAMVDLYCRREQMRKVMRVAGPRMMLRHPIMAIRHLLDGYRKAPPRKRRTADGTAG